jgi:hypothetical protein
MIFTFVDSTVQSGDPLTIHLIFYLMTPFPLRIAEGMIVFDFKKPGIVYGIEIKEHFAYTIGELVRIVFASLAVSNLILPHATHLNSTKDQSGSNTPVVKTYPLVQPNHH